MTTEKEASNAYTSTMQTVSTNSADSVSCGGNESRNGAFCSLISPHLPCVSNGNYSPDKYPYEERSLLFFALESDDDDGHLVRFAAWKLFEELKKNEFEGLSCGAIINLLCHR